jgi:hypothetical protein
MHDIPKAFYVPKMAFTRLARDIASCKNSRAVTFGKGLVFFLGVVTVLPVVADALTTRLAKHRGEPLFTSGCRLRHRQVAPVAARERKVASHAGWSQHWSDPIASFGDRRNAMDNIPSGIEEALNAGRSATTEWAAIPPSLRHSRALSALANSDIHHEPLEQAVQDLIAEHPDPTASFETEGELVDQLISYIHAHRHAKDLEQGCLHLMWAIRLPEKAQRYVNAVFAGHEVWRRDRYMQLS